MQLRQLHPKHPKNIQTNTIHSSLFPVIFTNQQELCGLCQYFGICAPVQALQLATGGEQRGDSFGAEAVAGPGATGSLEYEKILTIIMVDYYHIIILYHLT